MYIYTVTHYDSFEGNIYSIDYFSSERNAKTYLDKYLNKYKFDRKDFEIERHKLNPDIKWLDE